MPSTEPAVWSRDVAAAKRLLRPGQVLIVSVVGTPRPNAGFEALVEDFALCARAAAAAGADVVEANYSCPNVASAEGSIYQSAEASGVLTRALREALPSTRLLIKCGHFSLESELRGFYRAVGAHADGVVLVNGVSRRVLRADGEPVFPGHERSGIIGYGLHEPALTSVREAVRITRELALPVRTIGVGGVVGVEEGRAFLDAGAEAAMVGGGAAFQPGLAAEWKSVARRD